MLYKSLIPQKLVRNTIQVPCCSLYTLNVKHSNARSPEAIFLEKTTEVPIISVSEKENVDIIGPPDPVSNLRPIVRKQLLHETPLQQRLREMQDSTQEWNQKFWTAHNSKFIKERHDYVNAHKISKEENRTLTADEMSEFYKRFLDDNWRTHGLHRRINKAVIAGPKSKEPYVSVPLRVRTKLHTILPELAFNIKLFDEIGNNSKSQLFYTEYETILAFETRYELLMSWKTVYIVQYTVPAYPYLRRANDTYVLKMPLVDNILPGAFIQSAKTMVYLPEDSKLIQINATEDYVKLGESERVTTALSPRREVVVFNSVELVNGFAPNLYLVYSRGPVRVFKPAFYIITYIEIVFLCYLFISYVQPMMALKKP